MGLKVYIDGKLYPKEKAKISVFDHGLLYGDGVFEGIRSYNGRIFRLQEHLDRLYNSAKAICLTIPLSKQQMARAIESTLKANKLRDSYIRVVVTRGAGTLGLDPDKCPNPCVIVITDTISLYPQEFYEKGLEVVTVATVRNYNAALNPRIKSLNYLNNILAKIEGQQAGAVEAIMLNTEGCVAECTGDNIFIVRNKALSTPPVTAGILEGITRNCVIEIARKLGVAVREENMTRYDLFVADECFLTGTAAEIIPVVKIDQRPIGAGKPGPMTLQLLREFQKLTRNAES
jgi:branched-chain amino acid aminotransferase